MNPKFLPKVESKPTCDWLFSKVSFRYILYTKRPGPSRLNDNFQDNIKYLSVAIEIAKISHKGCCKLFVNILFNGVKNVSENV